MKFNFKNIEPANDSISSYYFGDLNISFPIRYIYYRSSYKSGSFNMDLNKVLIWIDINKHTSIIYRHETDLIAHLNKI